MPIGQRTPGPIHLFARLRGDSLGNYMGTCVAAPEPEHEKFKIPVMNDLGGRSVPFQLVQDGETALVMATLNRFDNNVIKAIRALESGASAGPAIVGQELNGARGTLNIGISDFQLIIIYQYAGTPSSGVFAGGISDLPAGRIYFSCNLRKYKESTVGTRVQEVALAIDCQNVYNPTDLSFEGGLGPAGLYSEDPADFGILVPYNV